MRGVCQSARTLGRGRTNLNEQSGKDVEGHLALEQINYTRGIGLRERERERGSV